MLGTIVIKCKNKTIKMDAPSEASDIVSRVAQEFEVDESRINLKLGGKSVDPSRIFQSKARLLAFISPKISSESAPTPVNEVNVSSPVSCKGWKKDCSFYGRESTEGYCSVCYKRMKKDTNPTEEPPVKKVKTESPSHSAPQPMVKQTNFNRCWTCNKKVGILGYKCKCEYAFCAKHRLPEMHECNIDFVKIGRENLTKQMSDYSVENKKIDKI